MIKDMPPSVESFKEQIKDWPTQPGVYLMKDTTCRIVYVGKAKNLRNRIHSYFQNPDRLSPKTRVLLRKIGTLEYTVTNTELEALLLECNLIKKHRPRYNIRLKDDKNFPYVVLDFTHPYPQFRISRKISTQPELKFFGPFSTGVRELGRFIQKTFQIRDCSEGKFKNRTRPCLNYEIGTCTAPCVGYVGQEDYAKQVKEASLFLKGKKRQLLSELKTEMQEASEKLEFEKARIARDKISAIERITEEQNAVLTDRQKDIDVFGCFSNSDEMQWVTLFIRAGFLVGRRAEKIHSLIVSEDDTVRDFMEQFYTESLVPDEIWVSTDFTGREETQALLSEKAGKSVRIKIKRDEKGMRLLGMAAENAKLIFLDQSKKDTISAGEHLQKILELPDVPHSIEGFDVSNLQGELPAVALVHFSGEKPLKSRYRLFYPRTVEGPNDFGMIYEAVKRRYSKLEQNPAPDLILIDGGKGQLSSALKALSELRLSIPVVAIAKSKVRSAFTLKDVEKTEERIFVPNRKNPIIMREGSPALQLLQKVRDEAHRFSLKTHRNRRNKEALGKSELTDIPGIGQKTKERLLKRFGGLEQISRTNVDELKKAGFSQTVAELLVKHFSLKK